MKPIEEEKNQNPGFKVPENYFEELEINVMQKANTSSKSFYLGRKVWAIAASIILIIGISFSIVMINNTTKNESELYSAIKDTNSKAVRIFTNSTSDSEKIGNDIVLNTEEEIINNEIVEFAEEFNLSDEELIEFVDLLEI